MMHRTTLDMDRWGLWNACRGAGGSLEAVLVCPGRPRPSFPGCASTISTHRRGGDPLLTQLSCPQVVGLRDVLHQAHPPAQSVTHTSSATSTSTRLTRGRWALRRSLSGRGGGGVTLLLWSPEESQRWGSTSRLLCVSHALFHLSSFGQKKFKTAAGPGGREVSWCLCLRLPWAASIQVE